MEKSIFLEKVHERLVSELERLRPQEIAVKTGIARATIYNWINRGNVPMDKLALLEGVGADVRYILTGQRAESALRPDEAALLDNYRNSPEEGKDAIKRTALALSKQKMKGKAA